MIQISGFVHQLDVCEADEKSNYRPPILVTNSNANGRDGANRKNQIGPFANRLNPFKSVVREKELGLYVKFLNPTVDCKTDDTDEH